MSDLRELMITAAPSTHGPSDAVADADIARGHRSLRLRRARRGFGVSGVAAVALIGGIAVTTTGGTPAGSAVPEAGSHAAARGVALVSYSGEQPTGFLLERVPAGWVVQSSTLDSLLLAPEGASGGRSDDWVGKLGVQLSLDVHPDVAASALRVDGRRAVVKTDKDGSVTLFVQQDEGFLVVQAWPTLGWDRATLIAFGSGVHVTDAAVGTAG